MDNNKQLSPTHFHAHPDGSYSVCDCKPPASSGAETKEQVVERLSEAMLNALEIDNDDQMIRMRPIIREAYEAGAAAQREKDARIAEDEASENDCLTCDYLRRIAAAIRREEDGE